MKFFACYLVSVPISEFFSFTCLIYGIMLNIGLVIVP